MRFYMDEIFIGWLKIEGLIGSKTPMAMRTFKSRILSALSIKHGAPE